MLFVVEKGTDMYFFKESKEELVVVTTERSRFGFNRPLAAASSSNIFLDLVQFLV